MTDATSPMNVAAPAADSKAVGSEAKHLTDEDFAAEVKLAQEKKIPLIVDFYAEWCGPCQLAAPVINRLSGEYAGKAIIAKVNVDENRGVTDEYGVMSIPTVIVIRDGEEFNRQIGYPGEAKYKEMIEDAIAG